MNELIRIAVALFPVFVFLVTLIFLDSFKLVRFRSVVQAILIGCLVALVCYFVNSGIRALLNIERIHFYRFAAPVIEELFKAAFMIYLIRSGKIGFMVDGAIYGFAIGSGFAFIENIFYLSVLTDANMFVWIIRGFGTAFMHGGSIAIFAIFTKNLMEFDPNEKFVKLLPGLALAILLHGIFNQFFFGPVVTTLIFLVGLPLLILYVYERSEGVLREWLEIGFDADAFLLDMINSGNIGSTKLGRYLQSLKVNFPGDKVADMLCLIRIYLELTIRAKGILLMREAGFTAPVESGIKEKLDEISYLEKSIGKTGKMAILPLIHTNSRELWQIYMVKGK